MNEHFYERWHALSESESGDVKNLNDKKVKVFLWLGNNPDLNPIENLWKILKDEVVEKQPTLANTFAKLVAWVTEMTTE